MYRKLQAKTALSQRMLDDMQRRNLSPETMGAYLHGVSKFARYFNCSPDRLGPEHIRLYQQFLIHNKKVAWSTYAQTMSALRFFYGKTLRRPGIVEDIPYPKRPRKLPIILSRQEVTALLLASLVQRAAVRVEGTFWRGI